MPGVPAKSGIMSSDRKRKRKQVLCPYSVAELRQFELLDSGQLVDHAFHFYEFG